MPGEPVTCRACGMADPPPEMTCTGGREGGILRDHRIGADKGCQHCGRLTEACAMRPCQAVRAMSREVGGGGDD